jgi:hypothetical protein
LAIQHGCYGSDITTVRWIVEGRIFAGTASVPPAQEFAFSANGAKCKSLGQRPRETYFFKRSVALKARHDL